MAKRFNPTQENLDKMQKMFEDFLFDQEIAEQLGASLTTIKKYRKMFKETGKITTKKLSSQKDTNKKKVQVDIYNPGEIQNAKIIVAFDQSSNLTGYSVWEEGKLLTYGVLDFSSPNSNLISRLLMIDKYLTEFIIGFKADAVYFEDIQLQKNVESFKTLAMVLGVCKLVAHKLKIPYASFYSTEWKSYCGIKGAERTQQKANAKKYVFNKFGIKVTEDEADAICIGEYAVSLSNKKQYLDWD